MIAEIQTIRLMADLLDGVGVALCLFDETPATLLWNRRFVDMFPEHAGHVHVGELYSDNLRRFYRERLDAAELVHLERYVADGVMRHTVQRLPFEFTHHGRVLRVASLPVPGVGRLRIWSEIAPAAASDTGAGRPDPIAADRAALEDVADGMMLRGRDGRIRAVNRRFLMLYGLGATVDPRGESFEALLRGLWGDDPMLESALLALADNQRFAGAPFEIPLPGGRWVRVSEQASREGVLVSTHADISSLRRLQREAERARLQAEAGNRALVAQIAERERAEAALRQSQRVEAIGQITGGVAHDFGNLLSVVMGNLDMLSARETDALQLRRLGIARSAAERGAKLTGQLLAFARQQPLLPVAVDLNALIAGMAPLLRSALGAQVSLVLQPADAARRARVDPTQLELVVLNLAINARDAMPEGGTLTIGTANEDLAAEPGPDTPRPGRYVALFVADTGTGMTEAVRARAFEPFFTTKATGSGLGLSQTYGLARQSGGTARLISAPGCGTRVEVLLPEDVTVDAPVAAPVTHTRATILVVDDNSDVRETTAMLLQRLGYATLSAGDGSEALAMLHRTAGIDLLLSDVSMPVMTGPQLARAARDVWPGLPIILFSGFADPDGLAEAPADCPLLRKPIRARDLAAAIAAGLSGPSAAGHEHQA